LLESIIPTRVPSFAALRFQLLTPLSSSSHAQVGKDERSLPFPYVLDFLGAFFCDHHIIVCASSFSFRKGDIFRSWGPAPPLKPEAYERDEPAS
jgi:hypothetical protein